MLDWPNAQQQPLLALLHLAYSASLLAGFVCKQSCSWTAEFVFLSRLIFHSTEHWVHEIVFMWEKRHRNELGIAVWVIRSECVSRPMGTQTIEKWKWKERIKRGAVSWPSCGGPVHGTRYLAYANNWKRTHSRHFNHSDYNNIKYNAIYIIMIGDGVHNWSTFSRATDSRIWTRREKNLSFWFLAFAAAAAAIVVAIVHRENTIFECTSYVAR